MNKKQKCKMKCFPANCSDAVRRVKDLFPEHNTFKNKKIVKLWEEEWSPSIVLDSEFVASEEFSILLALYIQVPNPQKTEVIAHFIEKYPSVVFSALQRIAYRIVCCKTEHAHWGYIQFKCQVAPQLAQLCGEIEKLKQKGMELQRGVDVAKASISFLSCEKQILLAIASFAFSFSRDWTTYFSSQSSEHRMLQLWMEFCYHQISQNIFSDTFDPLQFALREKNILEEVSLSEFRQYYRYAIACLEYKDFIVTILPDFCFPLKSSSERSKWDLDNQKRRYNHQYWLIDTMDLFYELSQEQIFGAPEGVDANKEAFQQALAHAVNTEKVHGVYDIVESFDDIYQLLIVSESVRKYCSELNVKVWLNERKESEDWLVAFKEFYSQSQSRALVNINLKESFESLNGGECEHLKIFYCEKKHAEQSALVLDRPFFLRSSVFGPKCVLYVPFLLDFWNTQRSIINVVRKKNIKQCAKNVELNLKNIFEHSTISIGSQLESQVDFNNEESNEKGEIDLLILQGNTLLVIEVKSTTDRVTVPEIFSYRKNLIQAGHQLNKAHRWILSGSSDLKKLFPKVDLNCINIEMLIVDTSFEYDHEFFGQSLKVSILEIMSLLKNDYWKMMNMNPLKNAVYENSLNLIDLYDEEYSLKAFVQLLKQDRMWQLVSSTYK